MKDIKEFAKDDEVTPSFIRKYLIEILGLGRASAYRFLQKSDSDFIVFTQKKYEKKQRKHVEKYMAWKMRHNLTW